MSFNSFKYRLNIYRRYGYWRRKGAIFIHVPKAAGTSVNNALYGRTLGHYTAAEIERLFPSLYQRCFTFSLVRNPWDRVLSAYRFACVGKTESMGVNNPEQYQIPEFDSFERFVCEWLSSCDVLKADFIFRPQYLFVCDDEKNIIVDHLGNLERIQGTLEYVESVVGFSDDVKVVNSTSSAGGGYRDEYVRDEMIEIVRRVYADDVSLFGYEF